MQLSRVTELIRAEGDRGRSDAERLCHHFGPEKGNADAKGGRIRLTQRPGGLKQFAEGVDLPVLGLHKAKWLNPSVARA